MRIKERVIMTTDYERYKAGEEVKKAKLLKAFWDTNPTEEQQILWNKTLRRILLAGFISGILCGMGFGILLWSVI